jgi:hypothetical protein
MGLDYRHNGRVELHVKLSLQNVKNARPSPDAANGSNNRPREQAIQIMNIDRFGQTLNR